MTEGSFNKKNQGQNDSKVIRKYLESGNMINGLEVISEEGVAQGGPLSPLLSNIMFGEIRQGTRKQRASAILMFHHLKSGG